MDYDYVNANLIESSIFIVLESMLKRVPTTTDGKLVDRLKESSRVNLPFKAPAPTKSLERIQPQRKRKRVSYVGQQEDDGSMRFAFT